ncbi:P-loop NTPase fold protein [Flavobacterium sp.]|jgi:hypothetical protein|uniref:KAP family P-loop NTPase fold protein n=1 Tax=Flavobacterium sp. TaxID=239 RepID=UPI0037BF4275
MYIGKHFLAETAISGDNVLHEDFFNFNIYAEKVKKLIQLNSSNNEPLTIGIYGKWGDGKTSFSNLIKHEIEHFEDINKKEYLVYDFNPWRYSTEDEILFDFFDGLKKQFYVKDKSKLQVAGEFLQKYSKYLKAVKISATVGLPKFLNSKIEFMPDKILEALGEDLKGEEITIEILRDKVNAEIDKSNYKILIFIDDIDRLDDNEIYTLFKLVKLNANFNNFIFILNFDEEQVGKALKKKSGGEVEDGKKYLEKIISIPIHIPKIEKSYLERYFRNQLAIILNNLDLKIDIQQDINSRIDFNNYEFKNPRQIKRVLNSFFISAFALNNEVNLIDLFSIEYIKITNVSLYTTLKGISPSIEQDSLSKLFEDNKEDGFNKLIEKTLQGYNNNFLIILFDKQRSSESLSIRNPEYFDRYFSYHIGNKTPSFLIESIVNNITKSEDHLLSLFKYDDAYYKILELIYNFKNKVAERDKLYLAIVKNIKLLADSETDFYGIDDRNRIIERIATYLDENNNVDNENISLEISRCLDVYQLCYFTRKFKDKETNFKPKLEKIIAEKAEQTFNSETPIFIIPSQPAKMTMIYWKKHNSKIFNKHIKDSLNNLYKIKKLIRNFPVYMLNESTYGGLIERDFDFMRSLIDIDFVYKQIGKFGESIVSDVNIDNFPIIDETSEYSEDDNLKQFIYWYKKNELKT